MTFAVVTNNNKNCGYNKSVYFSGLLHVTAGGCKRAHVAPLHTPSHPGAATTWDMLFLRQREARVVAETQ